MITVFKYKQKVIPKIVILVVMMIIPFFFSLNKEIYSSFQFYLILILLELNAFVYNASKKLIITENGIQEIIFWKFVVASTKWDDMEEAQEISGGGRTYNDTSGSIPALTGYADWLERISLGSTIKIIITNHEAKYLKLNDFKNSSELNKLLLDKIEFVK